jgi:hypothetical protein
MLLQNRIRFWKVFRGVINYPKRVTRTLISSQERLCFELLSKGKGPLFAAGITPHGVLRPRSRSVGRGGLESPKAVLASPRHLQRPKAFSARAVSQAHRGRGQVWAIQRLVRHSAEQVIRKKPLFNKTGPIRSALSGFLLPSRAPRGPLRDPIQTGRPLLRLAAPLELEGLFSALAIWPM